MFGRYLNAISFTLAMVLLGIFKCCLGDHQQPSSAKVDRRAIPLPVDDNSKAIVTVAPPGLGIRNGAGSGSLGRHQRSIHDWEVEDFVLLATVDGTLHARDRKTGIQRWEIFSSEPVVQTVYHRANDTKIVNQGIPDDDVVWIVEPVQDGALLFYSPDGGLQKFDITVKDIVEKFSPFSPPGSDKVYNGGKRTTTFAVDAQTGDVLRVFSSEGMININNTPKKCKPTTALEELEDECDSLDTPSKTILIGRTEYTITIQSISTGDPLWTIKYTEWGPNNSDKDLTAQHRRPMDNRYIYSGYDGKIYGFDDHTADSSEERRPKYQQTLPTPVIRVFDVVKSSIQPESETYLILPQPPVPAKDLAREEDLMFVGCTGEGGCYAMSEASYPYVTNRAPDATCYSRRFDWTHGERQKALVGLHRAQHGYNGQYRASLPAPSRDDEERVELSRNTPRPIPSSPSAKGSRRLMDFAKEKIERIGYICSIFCIFIYLYTQKKNRNAENSKLFEQTRLVPIESSKSDSIESTSPLKPQSEIPLAISSEVRESPPEEEIKAPAVRFVEDGKEEEEGADKVTEVVAVEEKKQEPEGPATNTPKKKKAHRGQRGGARKRGKASGNNNNNNNNDQRDDEKIDGIVNQAKAIQPEMSGMEPDIRIISSGRADDVESSSHVTINNLEIYEDVTLGTGSQGTIVYKGSFEGKEVAVKRILTDFVDLASHEISLLQQSDDHPNVIRYYCKQRAERFLYIALELCPATLHDVILNASNYNHLVSLMNPTDVLYQIASGVHHLHSLKIVHRDLKPQNILVSEPKPLPKDPKTKRPRLLISDFGLCKKLEGDQTSFRATTAQAAGTVGWRAPELLRDDDTPPLLSANTLESSGSSASSDTVIIDPSTNRRATRAIDIFSLGCVFFFVLSGGHHPFGDRFSRELNIVNNRPNFVPLNGLGDAEYEAKDLIRSMINHDPKKRPDANKVLIHPFFWPAEKRLMFLLDVSDRFEVEKDKEKDPNYKSPYIPRLERNAKGIVKSDWLKRLDRGFYEELLGNKRRGYDGEKVLDLLRAIRNKKHHYQDMKPAAKASVGSLPQGYLNYFTQRFPDLLLYAYEVVRETGFAEEPLFLTYYTAV
ncbi:bifunctional endoribonuclease/protein kinase ire1 [Rhizina undulata]